MDREIFHMGAYTSNNALHEKWSGRLTAEDF